MTFVAKPVLKIEILGRDQSKPTRAEFNIGAVAGVLPAITDIDTVLQGVADHYQNLTDCVVTGVNATYGFYQDTPADFGDAPDRERKGILQYVVTGNFPTETSIFGAKYAMFAPDGIEIIRNPADDQSFTTNPLAADLNYINSLFLEGITVGLVTYPIVDSRGTTIIKLDEAYKQTKANARG